MVQTRFLARQLHNHNITATSIAATVAGATTTIYYQYNKTDTEASPTTTTSKSNTTDPPSSSNNNDTPESITNPPQTTSSSSSSPSSSSSSPHIGIFETDFTDKLASKPYLNYHHRRSALTHPTTLPKRLWGKAARDHNRNHHSNDGGIIVVDPDTTSAVDEEFNDSVGGMQRVERPKGVPRRIRILSIDVPELREVFDGECRVNLTRIYPDDIAPPKVIKRPARYQDDNDDNDSNKTDGAQQPQQTSTDTLDDHTTDDSANTEPPKQEPDTNEQPKMNKKKKKTTTTSNNDEVEKLQVLQKSLARSLVRCRNAQSKRIGVELLEASVYDLNPHNMRRTYQLGSYRYDPGNYRGTNKNAGGDDMLQRRMSVGLVSEQQSSSVVKKSRNRRTRQMVVTRESGSGEDMEGKDGDILASDDDEMDAPWNQYAWIEEMQLRIKGHIPFGANVERSSFLSRILFGKCYRQTIKPSRSFLHYFIPSFLSGQRLGGDEGIDGDYGKNQRTVNRASSKPHAVIADGAAMQRVPGALRYLTKCCAEADLPLFIINDPRVWGGNTHSDLESAAKDLRQTLKARIVANALTIKEGKMFERGRLLGRIETEAKWQVKDVGRRTRGALQDASARLKKERDEDWSKLSGEELMQQLVDKKVISVANERKGEGKDDRLNAEVTATFAELCRLYVANAPSASSEEVEHDGIESYSSNEIDTGNAIDSSFMEESVADAEISS